MAENLCATCFFHGTTIRHLGKYGEIKIITWVCNVKPGRPVVYKKVTDRGKTLEEKPCMVTACEDYRTSWRFWNK